MCTQIAVNRDSLLAEGWCRGAFVNIIDNQAVMSMLPDKIKQLCDESEGAYLVPILYDCALIDTNFDREPWVQVVIGFVCDEDPNYRFSKNPRRLHLSVSIDNVDSFLEFNAVGFVQLDRQTLLTSSVPDSRIKWQSSSKDILINWVTERYRQAVFPDRFNVRLESKIKRLKKVWKHSDFCKNCSGIYIKINTDEELPDNKSYEIQVFIVTPLVGKELRNLRDNGTADNMVTMLGSILSSIHGVKLISLEVYPESQFTKKLEREYRKYSLEYYSYSSEDDNLPKPSDFYTSNMNKYTS
ncbi:MAG TPA: hypothetical protein DIT05_17880 [Morganella sp. (in: Bacteria)]|nr:hypothetical protein [Morganella sp. (in: enterobacteria)]